MAETIDHETGEISEAVSVPAVRSTGGVPTPYNSAETSQIAEAMAKAQSTIEPPRRTKTGKIQGTAKTGRDYSYEYKYAPFEEIVRVIRASFAENGLFYHQGLVTRGGEYFVRTFIRHNSGEWIASDYPVIADKSGPQGFAAATTYAKRYGLTLATGVAAEDDDDGASAQAAVPDARPATRANPAAQQPSADREAALAAYRRIQEEIDLHGTPEPMWPRADVEIVEKYNVTGLITLRQRLDHKMKLKEMQS